MENNRFSKGAEWRKWDLHLHTPSSYDYKDKSVSNEDIISALCDNDISVAAITDHHIIDIERFKELRSMGEVNGITVLPGIEFLTDARGDQPIHIIGIFSENCKIEYVWGQIENLTEISKIKGELKEINAVYCDLIDTVDLVHDLGGIVTIHSGQKHGSIESITNSLKHTMAQKEDIAKHVDIYELGKSDDQKGYIDVVFPFIKKRLPMVLCSDNHNANDFKTKENCWIKADPTFEGLKQIINEPEDRVFIGDKPEILNRIEKNRTKYIKELKITPHENYDNRYGKWYENVDIPFNGELVAIIGNKGSGKSAVADIIALCSNYQNHDDFSFLRPKKFRDGKHANNFNATLVWKSESKVEKSLDEKAVEGEIENVKYLPQGQFERLTNEINSAEEFQNEIEKVVFAHIDESEKMGLQTFKDLIKSKKRIVDTEISSLLDDLKPQNDQIIELEKKQSKAYRTELKNWIKKKEEELKALVEPPIVSNPNDDPIKKKESEALITKIGVLNSEVEKIVSEKSQKEAEKSQLIIDLKLLKETKKEIDLKVKDIDNFCLEKKELLSPFGLNIGKIFSYQTDFTQITQIISEKEYALLSAKQCLGDEKQDPETVKTLPAKLQEKQKELKAEQEKLGSEQKKYQDYLAAKQEWEENKNAIIGDEKTLAP